MSDAPELDQAAAARRQLAAHTQFSTTYWVFSGVFLVLVAGLPIWTTWLNPSGGRYITWVIAAVGIAAAVHSAGRRRSSGVYLPKRISNYPGARRVWLVGLAVTLAGFFTISALMHSGQRGIALLVLPVVAVLVLATQIKIRSTMRRDVEAGRVRP